MNTTSQTQQTGFSRLLSRVASIEPGETVPVTAAFFLFFTFFAGYFAVRPVRETIATLLGRQAVADLWLFTWLFAFAIVPLFGYVVARVRRSIFLPGMYAFVAVVLAFIGLAMEGEEINLDLGRFFYVFISVLNLFLVSVFWAFLLEIFNGTQTKRLFGFIAAGGTAGALFGPFIVDMLIEVIGNKGVLFFGATLFALAIVPQRILVKYWRSDAKSGATNERPIGGNPFAGFAQVFKSPYLLGIALFVVLLSTVSTILYFEQIRVVAEAFTSNTERTRVFARMDWIVQSLAIGSQLFLTGHIAKRFGVGTLLMIVPIVMIFGFIGLALSGTFTLLAIIIVARRSLEYAFARPGREMLWSPLDSETKYKAKNAVDVLVYRAADALSGQVNSGIITAGFSNAFVAMLGAGVAAAWAGTGWWLGKRMKAEVALKEAESNEAGRKEVARG